MNILQESEKIEALFLFYKKSQRKSPKKKETLSLSQKAILFKGRDAKDSIILSLTDYFAKNLSYQFLSKKDSIWYNRYKDDIYGDIAIWVSENIEIYKPGKGTLTGFLSMKSNWFFNDLLYKYSFDASIDDRISYQIKAISLNFIDNYTYSNGTNPTLSQIKDYLLSEFTSNKEEYYLSKDNTLSKNSKELKKIVYERLSRDGILSALKNLPEILSRVSSDIRLDLNISDEEGSQYPLHQKFSSEETKQPPLSDSFLLDSILDIASAGRDEVRVPILANFGLLEDIFGTATDSRYERSNKKSDKKSFSLSKVSTNSNIDKFELKYIIKSSKDRINSPIAHYAFIAN